MPNKSDVVTYQNPVWPDYFADPFALKAADELKITGLNNPLVDVVVWTIALSVVLHGLTAAPLARAYGRAVARSETRTPEHDRAVEPRVRRRGLTDSTSAPAG